MKTDKSQTQYIIKLAGNEGFYAEVFDEDEQIKGEAPYTSIHIYGNPDEFAKESMNYVTSLMDDVLGKTDNAQLRVTIIVEVQS